MVLRAYHKSNQLIGQTMHHKGTRLAIEGQGLVEYGLILVFVAVVVAVALSGVGTALISTYGVITSAIP